MALLLLALLGVDEILRAAALLLILDAVLHVLILEQYAEELNEVIEEEQEHRHHHHDQEAGAGLQIVEHLAHAGDAAGIDTHYLGFMNRQGVADAVVIALGLEDQVPAAVIDLGNSMGIQDSLAVDNCPVGDNITYLQLAGILHRLVDNQVAGVQCGVHRIRLYGEHPQTQHRGYAVAGRGHVGCVCSRRRNDNSDDQYHIDDGTYDLMLLCVLRLDGLCLSVELLFVDLLRFFLQDTFHVFLPSG